MMIVLAHEKSYVTLTQVSTLKSSEMARLLISWAPQKNFKTKLQVWHDHFYPHNLTTK